MSETQLLATIAALLVIVPATRIGAHLAGRLKQPQVIGEIVSGLLVGGLAAHVAPLWLAGDAGTQTGSTLAVIANLGIVFMMFQLGMEFDFSHLRQTRHRRAVMLIGAIGIAGPFAAGLAMAALYAHAGGVALSLSTALFCGIAFAVTALPVLARILVELRLAQQPVGTVAIACAALNDLAGWLALGTLAVTQTAHDSGSAGVGLKIALLGVFLGVVFLLFRPLAGWFLDRVERKSNGYSYDHIAAVLVAVLVAAAGSVMLGLHGALGAFVAGVALYDRKSLAQAWHRKISPLVDILLVPVFFVFTGTRTQLGQFGVDDLAWCAAWVAAACVSKTLASFFAARLSGMTRTDSLRIGIFLNTRGLTELVVLNVGLDLGLISPKLFTFLVIMALLSTVATVPLLKLLDRSWRWRRGALPGSAIEALK